MTRWVSAVAVFVIAGLGGTASASVEPTARSVAECRTVDVSASYRSDGAGMSHVYGRITVQNISARPCSIQGYGGLSFVGGGDGAQVGAPATRDPSPTPRTVLTPGARVSSLVQAAETAPYSRSVCRPAPVDGSRVYLPDETHALYVAHPTTGCRNPRVQLLGHQAFRPGTQR